MKLSVANMEMAAAETRAPCHSSVQDARRAQNLSCCPSSSSKFESDSSLGVGDAANRMDLPAPDLPPDTKWGLHRETNLDHLKDISHEQKQLNALVAELGVLTAQFVSQTSKLGGESQFKNGQDIRMNGLADLTGNLQKTSMNKVMGEFFCADEYLMDLNSYHCHVTGKPEKLSSDLESHWIGVEKNEPWWHTLDKDELASLVHYKSIQCIENSDLPQPHAKHLEREPAAYLQCCVQDKVVASLEQMTEKEVPNMTDGKRRTTSESMSTTNCTLAAEGFSPHDSERPFSNDDGFTSTKEDEAENQVRANSYLSKAQLLEALCHSQTRAREAEKAAQQAYDEKEHIIKLFFRQASHLFAYKQWLQILQLETLCLQLKNNNHTVSTNFPAFLPWVTAKGSRARKDRSRAAKRKPPPRFKTRKSVVAFALGLSLAGAGLLLGWTMGWLFLDLETAGGLL